MNLYMTLAPTRSRQILSENNWPSSVVLILCSNVPFDPF